MSNNSWYQKLISSVIAGSAVANTTTQTSVLPLYAKYTLGANWIEKIGDKFRIKACGKLSTAASTPGTLSWFVMFGAIAVFAGGASATLATSQTNVTWRLEIDLDVIQPTKNTTTSAQIQGEGEFKTAGLTALIQLLPATSPGPGTGFDSTASFAVDLQAAFSVANASNSITCNAYELVSCT